MQHDPQGPIFVGAGSPADASNLRQDCRPPDKPKVTAGAPPLVALAIGGAVSGSILGAIDGIAFDYIVGKSAAPLAACLWGAAIGTVGGAVFVLLKHVLWGPARGIEIGTQLGLLYGLIPGIGVFYQAIFVTRTIGRYSTPGLAITCCMLGLLLGGLLDRLIGVILFWIIRRQV